MLNHVFVTVLLSSFGIRCLVAEPCTRLYMQGLHATNYPQLAGVYVLRNEKWNDFPVYRHELYEVFLYYRSSEHALMIGQNQLHGLLRVEKKSSVVIESDVDYSLDHLFNFLSWKQWDPLRNKFVKSETNSVVKPVCVDENFGFCASRILHLNISDDASHTLNVSGPGGRVSNVSLDIRKVHFKLQVGKFHDIRPVYELISEVQTIPYYLYHQNGKWRVGAEIGSESAASGIILETESDVLRVEYEQKSEWYAVGSDGRQKSALRHLRCHHRPTADVNCDGASTDVCENGGSCHVDSTGFSWCVCTPDFRGSRCQHPISQCKQPLSSSSSSSSISLSDREGSIASTFCPSGRVLFSVCDGSQWSSHGSAECEADDDLPGMSAFSRRDPPEKIALVIASLVGVQLIFPFLCYCCISCCKFDENKLSSDKSRPPRKRLTTFVRACSGFFSVSWWVWFGYLIYYFCVWHGHVALDGTTVWSAVAIMAIICVCLLYIVVLCESICSHEYEYLTKLMDIMSAEEQITHMKSESPSIMFKAHCWHSETRTRTIHDGSGQDGNGMHTEMCTVQVSTAAFEELFSYSNCVDVSGNFLLPTSSAAVTQVFIELAIEFADEQTKRIYDEAFQLFQSSNRSRDEQVDFSVDYHLPSYVKELAIPDPNKRWMSSNYFVLATCLCLTWPYRWLLTSSKSEYHYRIVKKVEVCPTHSQPTVPAGHPIPIGISKGEGQPLLDLAPVNPPPITPPPPYEA